MARNVNHSDETLVVGGIAIVTRIDGWNENGEFHKVAYPPNIMMDEKQVLAEQQPAIADASGNLAATQETLNKLLSAMRAHGLIAKE